MKAAFGFLLLLVCAITAAQEIDNNLETEQKTEDYVHQNPTTGAIIWNKYTITATAAAGVIVTLGIASIIMLFFPALLFKFCYTFGTCNLQDLFDIHNHMNQPRDKRSLEQVGSILQTLAKAYQKFNEVPEDDRRVTKRSSDYLGPVLQIMTSAYDNYGRYFEKNSKAE